jgi:hypothetical protein
MDAGVIPTMTYNVLFNCFECHVSIIPRIISYATNCIVIGITNNFQDIPDSSILNLSKEQQKTFVKYLADNKSYEDAMDDLKTLKCPMLSVLWT